MGQMASPVKNCAQQGVYAPDAAPYDFYRGTAYNVCNSASKGGSLLQSTYPNKVIGLIIPKSTSTRTEYTFYIEHAP